MAEWGKEGSASSDWLAMFFLSQVASANVGAVTKPGESDLVVCAFG